MPHTSHCEIKVSKGANIRNRYNQVPHLTQDTNGWGLNNILQCIENLTEFVPFESQFP